MIQTETNNSPTSQAAPTGLRGNRTTARAVCMADAPKAELYDLEADPWAVKNLAADEAHAEALIRMKAEMTHWRELTADTDGHPREIKRRAK